MRALTHAVLLLAALVAPSLAQQYAGDPVPHQLPVVPGAEIAFFRITDPSGRHPGLTLTNYYSMQDLETPIDPLMVQRAVIIVHGLQRDPGNYMVYLQNALRESLLNNGDPNINRSSVAIIAPFFANGRDRHNTGGEHPPPSTGLYWQGSRWSAGASNRHPIAARDTVSSFDVLDQLVSFFDDRTRFPLMRQLVVAGHSLGAQTVTRYAQIGNERPTTSPLLYVIANPNSWTWMDTSRPHPVPPGDCPAYDSWRAGYANFTEYPMQYGRALVEQGGRAGVLRRWQARSKAVLVGLRDFDDALPADCASHAQGANHYERALAFVKAFPPWCPNPHHGVCDTVDYVDINHDAEAMLKSEAGLARMFRDNFYGDGSKSHDFGPRQQVGDSPYPAIVPREVSDCGKTSGWTGLW